MTDYNAGPQIRLLVCQQCKTIDELPDYDGDPRGDVLLEVLCERHTTNGTPHKGHLMKVAVRMWSNPTVKNSILAEMRAKGLGGQGLAAFGMPDYYEVKSQFADDAMTCFAQHNRPKGQCPDYRASHKQLIPKTADLRKDLGLSAPGTTGPKTYLCDFCPVKIWNITKAREAGGMYK